MYSYNSHHKVIVALIVICWAIFHFSQRKDEGLYYDNGQVKQTGSTKNSLNEGVWTWFYSDGTIQLQGEFHNGKREGLWREYNMNGLLISESTYLDNRLNGEFREFDASGNLITTRMYEKDVLLK